MTQRICFCNLNNNQLNKRQNTNRTAQKYPLLNTMRQLLSVNKMRNSPEYKSMLKLVLQAQIQLLLDQLSDQTGMESVCLSTSATGQDTLYLGSHIGRDFIETRAEIQTDFQGFCSRKQPSQRLRARKRTRGRTLSADQNTEDTTIDGGLEDGQPTRSGRTPKAPRRFITEVDGVSTPTRSTERGESDNKPTPHTVEGVDQGAENPENDEGGDDGTKDCDTKTNIATREDVVRKITSPEPETPPSGAFTCKQCRFWCKFHHNLLRHERVKHNIGVEGGTPMVTARYACAVCDYVTLYKSNRIRHERTVHEYIREDELGDMSGHKETPESTDQQSQRSETPNSMERYQTGRIKVVCSYCQLIFQSAVTLKSHIERDHLNKGALCWCGAKFSTTIEMTVHQESCPQVLEGTGQEVNVAGQASGERIDESATHNDQGTGCHEEDFLQGTGTQEVSPDPGITPTPGMDGDAARPGVVDVAPKVCELCGVTYRDNSTLIHHMRTDHRVDILFQCGNCNLRFQQESLLQSHQIACVNIPQE